MRLKANRFTKVILLSILFLTPSLCLYSQFNTYSPYTRFGLGDLVRPGLGHNLAMGGTGIAIHKNNRINYLNPAAYSAFDSTSVFFDFGANTFHNEYKTEDFTNTWWNMNLHHVAFGSSVGKYVAFSAGIVPYSSIGYNIKQEYNDYSLGEAMDVFYKGDGGILNFYVGASVKLFDRIALGVNMNYLMGRLTRQLEVRFPVSDYSQPSSRENFDLREPVFGLGIQYHEVFGETFFFTVGGTYEFATGIDASRELLVRNTIYDHNPVNLNDSVRVEPDYILAQDTVPSSFTLPAKIGVGLALGIPDKLTVTGDYYIQDWTDVLSGVNYTTTRASSMHFGVEYVPDVEALRGYHKLMTYRLGGYFNNYYLKVSDHQIEDYGITFGVGLPVTTLKTSINVSFMLGTRGTTQHNLIKENYGIITFNVTLHDLWFRKRRFD